MINFSVVDPEWFFRIRIILFSWIRIRIQILFRILHEFFLIFNINCTFVFQSCKTVRFFWVVLLQIYLGYGAVRNGKDFFRICIRIRDQLKILDPTGSGSTTLFNLKFCRLRFEYVHKKTNNRLIIFIYDKSTSVEVKRKAATKLILLDSLLQEIAGDHSSNNG